MNENLIIKLSKEKIIDKPFFDSLKNNQRFGLFADNILEGISFLNKFVLSYDNILIFEYVMYEPVDQPTYIFKDKNNNFYSISIYGAFYNWNLPDQVENLYKMMDIPDFALFNFKTEKTVFGGETTETASVGNSQWQREGRKISAATLGIPFVYQTFYSGKDESQDSVREPTSLQVFNHILYSIKYRIPSFVIYLDNNFNNGINKTRKVNAEELMVRYFKTLIIHSVNGELIDSKIELENKILIHMVDYVLEDKNIRGKKNIRISIDFPIINKILLNKLINSKEKLVEEIVQYLNDTSYNFQSLNLFTDFDYSKMVDWNSYNKEPLIFKIYENAINLNKKMISYQNRSKVGITNTKVIIGFLKSQNLYNVDLMKLLDKDETMVLPLRIHKKSNGELTFSPDPESGEIVAFSELFKEKAYKSKARNIFGICIVATPKGFNLNSKNETKMYKSLSRYVDLLLINNKLYFNLQKFTNKKTIDKNYNPIQKKLTEEVGIVSFFVPIGNSALNYEINFIHTHHSSWQQFIVRNGNGLNKAKINRISSKLDLVMQSNEKFILSEGKLEFDDFFSSSAEILKIQTAFMDTESEIKKLFNGTKIEIYKSFICTIPLSNALNISEINIKLKELEVKFNNNLLNKIVSENYFLCVVYVFKGKTNYYLKFSNAFDSKMKSELVGFFK
jgi:hypothetical protein